MTKPPAAKPCGSCPYRRDVPSGIWEQSEYEKLPAYDGETPHQPVGIFLCHRQDGRVCAGWAGTHDMDECLALRIAASTGILENPEAVRTYATTVPLFDSGAEAAEHGMQEIETPGPDAQRVMSKLRQARGEDP